jgi:hypothetical protein
MRRLLARHSYRARALAHRAFAARQRLRGAAARMALVFFVAARFRVSDVFYLLYRLLIASS